ncbi:MULTISPECIES: fibronectin type III domain-containing protein [Niastella]|uniref:Fibronectin type III domain-containing protein n=1 Tax=Niastella soli TaxID=2821487 RepID=A0ABS3YW50_9BACT|nr:fibronectin type III domain-containing protein [Niastella soli]MBO9202159.1 fibronectin type III domain-containing protein [Niastella soli]
MRVTLYKKTVSRLWLFVCLLAAQMVTGQQYPVQIVPQLQAPYTLNLSDYYNGVQDKLVVLLTNTDLNKPVMQVRLRMSIQGQVAKLLSRDNIYYPPIQLNAGIPLRIGGGDLAAYFNADNLIFQGITRAQYLQSGKLPEGFYQFCFEVVETETGLNQVVGRSSCAMAWISLNDPPLLNLPVKAESIVYKDPQNIIFQWTPRNYNSPVSAFNTEYEFSLVELWDNGVAPEAAFGTAQPLYRTTTKSTTLLYGPAEPLLLTGHRYAWRIRAQPTEGTEGGDVWRNNGYSEISWFTCQNNCAAPVNVQAEIKSSSATVTWTPNPNQTAFMVDYREKGQAAATWYSSTTNTSRMVLTELKKEKTYEYRVGGTCDNGNTYTYSEIRTLTMGKDSAADSTCGTLTAAPDIANRTAIQTLLTGDVIVAGDFPVKLMQVSGQRSFTGTGYVTVPFLGQNRVKVKFSSITVNTDKQLIGGYIESTYDSTEKQIANLDQVFDGGKDVGIVRAGVDTAGYYIDMVIPDAEHIKVTLDTDTAGASQGTTLIITGADGTVKEVKVEEVPTTIKDKNGTVYGIDKEGTVTKISESAGTFNMTPAGLNTLQPSKAVVRFIPHPNQQYAFDAYQSLYANSNLFKEKYEKLAGEYYVNAKLITETKTDVIKAVIAIKDTTIKANNIRFITAKGVRYESKPLTDSTWEINLVGGPGGDAQELYALYPQDSSKFLSLGKLLIASYKPQVRKLVLVPVNGATTNQAAISEQLNAIYNPVGVTFNVTQEADLNDNSWDLNGDHKLAVSGSSWLSTQTNEMKALNSVYAKARSVQNDAVYLFVLNSSDSSIAGEMPRGKQFGYLFNGGDGHAVAHETGHGLFQLKHVFDGYGFKQGELPSNVMDYPAGNNFTKYQWDALHDPGVVVPIFEKPGDAELRVGNVTDFEKLKNVKTNTYTFLSPGGFPVTLPATATNINLSETNYFNSTSEKDSAQSISFGTLIGFSLPAKENTVRYLAKAQNGTASFLGYFPDDGSKDPYNDSLSAKETGGNIIIAFPSCHVEDTAYAIKARWAQVPDSMWKKTQDSGYRASGYLKNAGILLEKIAVEDYEKRYEIPAYDITGSMRPYSEFEGSKEATVFLYDNTRDNAMPLPVIVHIANLIKLYPVEFSAFRRCGSGALWMGDQPWVGAPAYNYAGLKDKAHTYMDAFVRFVETTKKQKGKVAAITNVDEMRTLLGNTCEEMYKQLTAEERIKIIKLYTQDGNWIRGCFVGDEIKCEEKQLITVLTTVPDNEQAVMIANFLNEDSNLPVLYRLTHDVDGSNREAMLRSLFELFQKKDQRSAFTRGDLLGNRLFCDAKYDYGEFYIHINDKIDFYSQNNRCTFTINRIKEQKFYKGVNSYLQQKYQANIKDNGYEWITNIHPFDAVTVVFGEDFTLTNGQTLFSNGDIVRMPALYLWHMNDIDAAQTAALLRDNAIKFVESVKEYGGLALEVNTADYVLKIIEELHGVYTTTIRPSINRDSLDGGGRKMVDDLDKLAARYEVYNDGKEWFDVLKEFHDFVNVDESFIPKLKEFCKDQVQDMVVDKFIDKCKELVTTLPNIVTTDWKANWKNWENYGTQEIGGETYAAIGDWYFSREAITSCTDNPFGVLPTDIEEAIDQGTTFIKDDGPYLQKIYDYDQIRVVTETDGLNFIVRTLSLVDWNKIGLPKALKNVTYKDVRNRSRWTDEQLLQGIKEAYHEVNIKNKGIFNIPDGTYTGYTKEHFKVEFTVRKTQIESISAVIIL